MFGITARSFFPGEKSVANINDTGASGSFINDDISACGNQNYRYTSPCGEDVEKVHSSSPGNDTVSSVSHSVKGVPAASQVIMMTPLRHLCSMRKAISTRVLPRKQSCRSSFNK